MRSGKPTTVKRSRRTTGKFVTTAKSAAVTSAPLTKCGRYAEANQNKRECGEALHTAILLLTILTNPQLKKLATDQLRENLIGRPIRTSKDSFTQA